MFWEKFVRRVYRSLGNYISERQREGAIVEVEPAVVVRAFIGMVMHHSLNNNLWDRKRRLLKISNQVAAREFAGILLNGIAARAKVGAPIRSFKAAAKRSAVKNAVKGHRNGSQNKSENTRRKRSRK